MKRISYVCSILLALIMTAASFPGASVELVISENSRMWVEGTSTLHDWSGEVASIQGTIELDAAAGTVSRADITVASTLVFENGTMQKKADRALKVDDFSTVRFTLQRANVSQSGESLSIDAVGALTLAGVTRDISSEIVASAAANGGYVITGALSVTMTDFGVDPPTAMLGTIRTGDEVTVRFELLAVPAGTDLTTSN